MAIEDYKYRTYSTLIKIISQAIALKKIYI